jgi:hypothetical protein
MGLNEICIAGEISAPQRCWENYMNQIAYVPPTVTDLGDFTELTLCTPWGDCRDFLGCARAPICI